MTNTLPFGGGLSGILPQTPQLPVTAPTPQVLQPQPFAAPQTQQQPTPQQVQPIQTPQINNTNAQLLTFLGQLLTQNQRLINQQNLNAANNINIGRATNSNLNKELNSINFDICGVKDYIFSTQGSHVETTNTNECQSIVEQTFNVYGSLLSIKETTDQPVTNTDQYQSKSSLIFDIF